MSWWLMLLLPVSLALLTVATVIGVALTVSAEDQTRRLHLYSGSRRARAYEHPDPRARVDVPPSMAASGLGKLET